MFMQRIVLIVFEEVQISLINYCENKRISYCLEIGQFLECLKIGQFLSARNRVRSPLVPRTSLIFRNAKLAMLALKADIVHTQKKPKINKKLPPMRIELGTSGVPV